jgi:Icc-related predicted phosphoesterase
MHSSQIDTANLVVSQTSATTKKISFDYVSDVHVDCYQKNELYPIVNKTSNYLLVAGDIGVADHPNVDKFLSHISFLYNLVFIVPGNHEYDLGLQWKNEQVNKYTPILQNICNKYENIWLLNGNVSYMIEGVPIIGTTLWTDSQFYKSIDHNNEHKKQVEWLSKEISKNKNIIVITHHLPSKQLMDKKYLTHPTLPGYYTDLEYLIKPPVKAWICGHSHSRLNKIINGVYCGVNAIGLNYSEIMIDTFEIETSIKE